MRKLFNRKTAFRIWKSHISLCREAYPMYRRAINVFAKFENDSRNITDMRALMGLVCADAYTDCLGVPSSARSNDANTPEPLRAAGYKCNNTVKQLCPLYSLNLSRKTINEQPMAWCRLKPIPVIKLLYPSENTSNWNRIVIADRLSTNGRWKSATMSQKDIRFRCQSFSGVELPSFQ